MKRRTASTPRFGSKTAKNALVAMIAAHGVGARADSDDRLVASLNEKAVQLPGVVVSDSAAQQTPSSPKFTEPVSDTPQTISVIPPEIYAAQGANSLSDVL